MADRSGEVEKNGNPEVATTKRDLGSFCVSGSQQRRRLAHLQKEG
jgi:hypothetical protein